MHPFIVVRKSNITTFLDAHRVEASSHEAALYNLFHDGTFVEESSLHKRVEVFNKFGVIGFKTQLFLYMVIQNDYA
jgi:hypothetical protein